jgi:hypothetical protein
MVATQKNVMISGPLPPGPLPHPIVRPLKAVTVGAVKQQAEHPPRSVAPVQFMLNARQPAASKPPLLGSIFEVLSPPDPSLHPFPHNAEQIEAKSGDDTPVPAPQSTGRAGCRSVSQDHLMRVGQLADVPAQHVPKEASKGKEIVHEGAVAMGLDSGAIRQDQNARRKTKDHNARLGYAALSAQMWQGNSAAQYHGRLQEETGTDSQRIHKAAVRLPQDSVSVRLRGRRGWDCGPEAEESAQHAAGDANRVEGVLCANAEQKGQATSAAKRDRAEKQGPLGAHNAQDEAKSGSQTQTEIGQVSRTHEKSKEGSRHAGVDLTARRVRSNNSQALERSGQKATTEQEHACERHALCEGTATAVGSGRSASSSRRTSEHGGRPVSAVEPQTVSTSPVPQERSNQKSVSCEQHQSGFRNSMRGADNAHAAKHSGLDIGRKRRQGESLSSSDARLRQNGGRRLLTDALAGLQGPIVQQATSKSSAINEADNLSLLDTLQQPNKEDGQDEAYGGRKADDQWGTSGNVENDRMPERLRCSRSLQKGSTVGLLSARADDRKGVRKGQPWAGSSVKRDKNRSLQHEQASVRISGRCQQSPSEEGCKSIMIIEADGISCPGSKCGKHQQPTIKQLTQDSEGTRGQAVVQEHPMPDLNGATLNVLLPGMSKAHAVPHTKSMQHAAQASPSVELVDKAEVLADHASGLLLPQETNGQVSVTTFAQTASPSRDAASGQAQSEHDSRGVRLVHVASRSAALQSIGPDTLEGLEARLQAMMSLKRARAEVAGVLSNDTSRPTSKSQATQRVMLHPGKEVGFNAQDLKEISQGELELRADGRASSGAPLGTLHGSHGRTDAPHRQMNEPVMQQPRATQGSQQSLEATIGLQAQQHEPAALEVDQSQDGAGHVPKRPRQLQDLPHTDHGCHPPQLAPQLADGRASTRALCAQFCQCVYRRQRRECSEAARKPSKPPLPCGSLSFNLPCLTAQAGAIAAAHHWPLSPLLWGLLRACIF